ncbi:hypothetical protein [Pandoraea sputorum]|uniref:Uncharacterized protein n=1 Tax=Pandoraea sputorum TaxID=93222 RepID=A0A5E5BGX8_9BURK|nr:hypothetical protein [Pandoraea sputorum]VVE85451.1 hypothetical protein PSP31121_05260 [Pandoraea sputorum]
MVRSILTTAIRGTPRVAAIDNHEKSERVRVGCNEAYYQTMNFKSLASWLFVPPNDLPKGVGTHLSKVLRLPCSISQIRPEFQYIYFIDPLLFYEDACPSSRIFGENMFDAWRGTKHTERFCAGMRYAESPGFDVGDFECIKEIYRIVDGDVKLCVPTHTRDFLVSLVSADSYGAKYSVMRRHKAGSVCFNTADRTLNLKEAGVAYCAFQFKRGIDELEKNKFIDDLKTTDRLMSPERLGNLFEYVKYALPETPRTYDFSATYGPGYAHMYFPGQQYPQWFALDAKPTLAEIGFLLSSLEKNHAGHFVCYRTNYKDEAQIKGLYEAAFNKYKISSLQNFSDDEQISLIAGFVSTMVYWHFFGNKNNRIWMQILLNHMLRSCGLSDAILAVPNGFAHAIRYDWVTGGLPDPATPGYVEVMRPAIDAIRDGMAYYRSLCA